jgi:hypothetical protein
MKTKKELQELKDNWLSDPVYDISPNIQIDRLQRAIESLNNFEAYKIMMCYDEE